MTTQRSACRTTISAVTGSPSSTETSPKKLPVVERRPLLVVDDDADLAVDDDEEPGTRLPLPQNPAALGERLLVQFGRDVAQFSLGQVGENAEPSEPACKWSAMRQKLPGN